MRAIRILSAIAAVLISASSFAIDDTPENRLAQIERYLAAVPPDELFHDMTTNVSMNFPPEDRAAIREFMTEYVDIDVLTEAMVASMLNHFTADELKALADFYGSELGKSAMEKFGPYMAEVMPVIESEVLRALGEFQKAKAADNRQLPDPEE